MVAGPHETTGRGAGVRRLAAALAAIALSGCASLPEGGGAGASPEASANLVRQRAEARWAATIKGDNVAAYQYLSPGSKGVVSLEQYILRAPRGIRIAAVTGVDCAADTCKVSLSLTYDAKLVKGVVTPHFETWVLDKGQWWYVHRV